MKKKQRIALLVCAVLCLVIGSATFFLARQSSHPCEGEACHICVERDFCHAVIQTISTGIGATAVLAVFVAMSTAQSGMRRDCIVHAFPTLVSLKVKLSN